MKIIDKKSDYYDYIQLIYQDDTLTFDRRDSYELDKKLLCQYLDYTSRWYYNEKNPQRFLVMQIGASFWLFLLNITSQNETNGFYHVKDYDIELIASWKNYDVPRELIKLYIPDFAYKTLNQVSFKLYKEEGCDSNLLREKKDVLIQAITHKDYYGIREIGPSVFGTFEPQTDNPIPLLKSSGIPTCVEPQEIYDAFEEYFSLEKTASERTDAEGTTNKDKIINHGFDTKVSFRGGKK